MKVFYPHGSTAGYQRSIFHNFMSNSYSFESKRKVHEQFDEIVARQKFQAEESSYLEWDEPNLISNAIFQIGNIPIEAIAERLDMFLRICEVTFCQHIVLVFDEFLALDVLQRLLNGIEKPNIHSVLVCLQYSPEYYSDELGSLIMGIKTNKKLFVFNSPFEKNFEDTMFFTQQEKFGGTNKKMEEFVSNITLYSESLQHNPYFNRKLYIGSTGEIKNAPEMTESFGFIQNLKSEKEILKIISKPEFQKYWFVHKDLCDVCKVCEFRNMCTDNRIPLQRSSEEWYYDSECNYNPYISKWEGEDGFFNLSQCGVLSNELGFSENGEITSRRTKNL